MKASFPGSFPIFQSPRQNMPHRANRGKEFELAQLHFN